MRNSDLLHATWTTIYLKTEICFVYWGEHPYSPLLRSAWSHFYLIHENSRGSALYEHMRKTCAVQRDDGNADFRGSVRQLFLLLWSRSCCNLCWKKPHWQIIFSFVTRQLLLNFSEGTMPLFIFTIDFKDLIN